MTESGRFLKESGAKTFAPLGLWQRNQHGPNE
jgi:hypothetical protein